METPALKAVTAPKRIVVGLDGSARSARGLAWAIGTAKALEAEVLAVHVFQLLPQPAIYGLAPIAFSDEWQQELRKLFENDWCAPLRAAGVGYRTVFEAGSPAPTLISIAQREHADLIVTGTRGLGGFKQLMLGSVSYQLVLHSTVPVVAIPAEAEMIEQAPSTAKEHEAIGGMKS
ncbi:MAG TPA: universal stress protein [Candidatus Dormibacteraeota bacterium]|nr:universal stress protein [Candidatus Dormibacteraeota bacterium]